eukprot:3215067-Ditylum_brightwellii.AAC.1
MTPRPNLAWGKLYSNKPMPTLSFSPFLTTALGVISVSSSDYSKDFVLLVCQVAANYCCTILIPQSAK